MAWGAPLDLQDERSKGGHPIQLGRGICSLLRMWGIRDNLSRKVVFLTMAINRRMLQQMIDKWCHGPLWR